ncbi:MAG: hypothetical protein V4515_15080 [Chloroflexota bacterium]
MTTSTVIDLIDNVIHDWTMSDDAMRWNPDASEPAPVTEWTPTSYRIIHADPRCTCAQCSEFSREFRRGIEVAKAAVDEVAAFWGVRAARLRRMHGLYPRRWRR